MDDGATAHRAGRARGRRAAVGRVVTVLAAVALAGCGGPGEEGRGIPGDTRPAASRSGADAPPVSPSVPAADGRDPAACADGDCEIAVSGPVAVRFDGPAGRTTVSVSEVGPHRIEYAVESGNGRSASGTEGRGHSCRTVLRAGGSATSCGAAGDGGPPGARPGTVVVQVVPGEDGTALLRVVSG
ncbi:hypothetical protein [Streptomyces prasinopilosus]|uniref:Uncharacterized protein n=1 Tax=Streptomyces prasinopilosus TaxID=67344 RepID=A0A1G6YKY6_9ACTN|nr:hypothetical protein [Streptomyces prasinopilosus]SDD91048.1 hypothetical protein SAMN05216505_11399 [Streptomyces prasinopilosus]